MESPARACLLGPLRFEQNGQPCPAPKTAKARGVLAYLLLAHPQPVPRLTLASQFWPDQPEARARRSLSTALWQIQQALPGWVLAIENAVQLPPALWVDAAAFTAAVTPHLTQPTLTPAAQATLQQALTWYAGDALPGWYDDWAVAAQTRWRDLYQQTLHQLLRHAKRQGDFESGLRWALALTRSDPLHETAQREVLQLYLALNRPQNALAHFENYRQRLSAELGLDPEPETWALVNTASAQAGRVEQAAPVHWPTATAAPALTLARVELLPLVGREAERAQLLEHLENRLFGPTPAAERNLVLVEGEVGIGKTRLVQEVARDAAWRGAQVLWGQCAAGGAARPYGLLAEVLTSGLNAARARQLADLVAPLWLQVLGRLCPALQQWLPDLAAPPAIPPAQERERVWEATVQALRAWAKLTPLLIIIEDLHQPDEELLALPALFLGRFRAAPMLFLGTYRNAEARQAPLVWQALQKLDRQAGLARLRLAPLTPKETDSLARQLLKTPQLAKPLVQQLYQNTQGHPLFIIHTLRWQHEAGLLAPNAAGEWALTPKAADNVSVLPPLIAQSLAERWQQLSPPLQQMLNCLAVLGGRAQPALLAALTHQPNPTLQQGLQTLVAGEFLTENAQGFAFSHAALREWVYAQLNPAARARLHCQVGDCLAQEAAPAAEALAFHYESGQAWALAAQYAQQAGANAQTLYANATARQWYQRALTALAHLPPTPETQAQEATLHQQLGKIMMFVGDYSSARPHLEQAWQLLKSLPPTAGRGQQQAQLSCHLAELGERQGDLPGARQWLAQGLSLVEAAAPTLALGEVYRWLGRVETYRGNYAEAQDWVTSALHTAHTLAAHRLLGDSLRLQALIQHRQGHYDQARADYATAQQVYESLGDRSGVSFMHNGLGAVAYSQHQHAEAESHFQQAYALMQAVGDRAGEAMVLGNLALLPHAHGNYPAATRLYQKALALYQELGDRRGECQMLLNVSNLLADQGDLATAIVSHQQAIGLCQSLQDQHTECMALCDLALWQQQMAQTTAAQTTATAALALAQKIGERRLESYAQHDLGLVLTDLQQFDSAAQHLHWALALREQLRLTPLIVETQLALARWHLAQGQGAAALARLNTVWAQVESGEVTGADAPLALYLICYEVLRAAHDRRAQQVLNMACELLQERAHRLGDPALQHTFLQVHPIHRALLTAYAQEAERRATTRQVWLPPAHGPARGPLGENRKVAVSWTIWAETDDKQPNKVARRHSQLRRLLHEAAQQGAAPTVNDLAAALGASWRTITRDLETLRAQGHTVHTRGQ